MKVGLGEGGALHAKTSTLKKASGHQQQQQQPFSQKEKEGGGERSSFEGNKQHQGTINNSLYVSYLPLVTARRRICRRTTSKSISK